MLIDECTQLTKLAQDVTDLKKYAADLGKFRDRLSKIKPLVEELSSIETATKAFREKGLMDFDFSHKTDALLGETAFVLSKFQKDRGWLIEEFKGKSFQKFESKIADLKNELETYFQEVWITYKRQKLPKTNPDLLELLEKDQGWKIKVQRVKSRLAKINAVAFPQDSGQFQKIDQEIALLVSEWNSLSSGEVPIAVQDFLKAATTHGATLDRFTPEIKAWLDEKGLSRFFYIRVSN
ncbi:hypothetical protein [Leptolyngbya sp. FACHB-261]|uniref:hypothetical protein n=1 Tax=Leptolyngbya sp. FACHB-261 TaxID=2692806 RepID=UPI0016861721|nr:hypothetical protein [Leptolyngbya sp. FACHB-261]MBD2101017.1 hypothetical protein [Leptolyngbya sp. FACHB-261]